MQHSQHFVRAIGAHLTRINVEALDELAVDNLRETRQGDTEIACHGLCLNAKLTANCSLVLLHVIGATRLSSFPPTHLPPTAGEHSSSRWRSPPVIEPRFLKPARPEPHSALSPPPRPQSPAMGRNL